MSDFVIAFLATASAATWTYSKAARRTGGNVKNASIAAAVVGIMVFIIMLTVLNAVGNSLKN